MIKLIIFIAIIYFIFKKFRSLNILAPPSQKHWTNKNVQDIDDVMVKDPVCNVYIQQREAISICIDGKNYYFCSTKCRDEFLSRQNQK